MTARSAAPLLLTLLLSPLAARAESDCAALAVDKAEPGLLPMVAKEPEIYLRSSFSQRVEEIDRCPALERLWYHLLRTAEIGGAVFPATLAGVTVVDLKAASSEAAHRFPRSARIATVRARALGTVDSAQQALALDEKWAPARIALAAAQIKLNDTNTAQRTLAPLGDLSAFPCGPAILANAKLLSGDYPGAIAAASVERPTLGSPPLEPTSRPFEQRCARDALEVRGLAQLASGTVTPAARTLLSAAAQGAELAQRQLRAADPKLKTALHTLRKDRRLPANERDYLKTLH